MKKHHIWMLILCLIPMLLIFTLPAARSNSLLFIVLMALCCGSHLFMMKGLHHGTHDDSHKNHEHKEREIEIFEKNEGTNK